VLFRRDPGPCIVCGAPHTSCTGPSVPTVLAQLPQRDRAVAPVVSSTPVNDAVQATLPVGQTTTAHYRGKRGARR